MYLHPARVSEPLLAAWAQCQTLVPYLDLPLQHAAPGVLKRMGRAGSPEAYLELLSHIREHLPEAALRTTFIVAFPARPRQIRGAVRLRAGGAVRPAVRLPLLARGRDTGRHTA